MLPHPVTKYLQTRSIQGPWRISGCTEMGFRGVVVIPALAEHENIFSTLASLAKNPPQQLARFLVLVVVNQRVDAPGEDRENNRRTLAKLKEAEKDFTSMRLAWVDAASPGLEMPAKGGGVGLARKIGLDLALDRLDYRDMSPLLVCLDADTLVEPGYLPAIDYHFNHSPAGGASIPFRHRTAETPEGQKAIDRYELFLRGYVFGLSLAGSPYAFHTVGSAMACTAAAYVRMGGMNKRQAAEDFYFLQQLHRTSGVEQLSGTTVLPSPRGSHRVPFGTGRSVSRTLAGEDGAVTFYRPQCFRILGRWLECIDRGSLDDSKRLMALADAVSPNLAAYLEEAGFPVAWEKLMKNHGAKGLATAFHGWFDGLRTMKLIHHLSASGLPRCGPEEAIPPLLRWGGYPSPEETVAQLELLRSIQQPCARGYGLYP